MYFMTWYRITAVLWVTVTWHSITHKVKIVPQFLIYQSYYKFCKLLTLSWIYKSWLFFVCLMVLCPSTHKPYFHVHWKSIIKISQHWNTLRCLVIENVNINWQVQRKTDTKWRHDSPALSLNRNIFYRGSVEFN